MTFTEKPLFQSQPASTTAATLYTPSAGVTGLLKSINVANASTASATFSLYHDIDGLTYNSSSILYPSITVDSLDTLLIEQFIAINSTASGIGVAVGTANALTFSGYGAEVTT